MTIPGGELGDCCDQALCGAAERVEEIYDALPEDDYSTRRVLRQLHKAILEPVGAKATKGYLAAKEKLWFGDGVGTPMSPQREWNWACAECGRQGTGVSLENVRTLGEEHRRLDHDGQQEGR